MTDFKGKFERTRPFTVSGKHDIYFFAAERIQAFTAEIAEANAREDECWRMFGLTVSYHHDERIVTH